jgi:hypothetical protein
MNASDGAASHVIEAIEHGVLHTSGAGGVPCCPKTVLRQQMSCWHIGRIWALHGMAILTAVSCSLLRRRYDSSAGSDGAGLRQTLDFIRAGRRSKSHRIDSGAVQFNWRGAPQHRALAAHACAIQPGPALLQARVLEIQGIIGTCQAKPESKTGNHL